MKNKFLKIMLFIVLILACCAPISQAQYSQNGYGNQRQLVLEKEGDSFGVAMLKSWGSVFAISLLACAGIMIWKFLIIGFKGKQNTTTNTINIIPKKESSSFFQNKQGSNSSCIVSEDEENAYELAQQELDKGSVRKGLWAKVAAEEPDKERQKSKYIQYRAQQILSDLKTCNMNDQISRSKFTREVRRESVKTWWRTKISTSRVFDILFILAMLIG